MRELTDAYAERKYQEAQRETWGHLHPECGKTYKGSILFAHGEYGDLVPLRVDFDGLPDSPWFFDHMTDFIGGQATEVGKLYLFTGTYCVPKPNQPEFVGSVRAVEIQAEH